MTDSTCTKTTRPSSRRGRISMTTLALLVSFWICNVSAASTVDVETHVVETEYGPRRSTLSNLKGAFLRQRRRDIPQDHDHDHDDSTIDVVVDDATQQQHHIRGEWRRSLSSKKILYNSNDFDFNNDFDWQDVDCDWDDRACQIQMGILGLVALVVGCLCCCCFRNCCFWCCGGFWSAIFCLGGRRQRRQEAYPGTTRTTRRVNNNNNATTTYQTDHYHYHIQQQQQNTLPRRDINMPTAPYEDSYRMPTSTNHGNPYETVPPITVTATPMPSAPYEEDDEEPINDSTPLVHAQRIRKY